jgi:hypothetical protein
MGAKTHQDGDIIIGVLGVVLFLVIAIHQQAPVPLPEHKEPPRVEPEGLGAMFLALPPLCVEQQWDSGV